MDTRLRARPGLWLLGTSSFGLASWLGILGLALAVPGVETHARYAAACMALLFAVLLAIQVLSSVDFGPDGLSSRSPLRRVGCTWDAVRRLDVYSVLPGLRIYVVATARGPFAFSSLWRRHRELVEALRERGRLD